MRRPASRRVARAFGCFGVELQGGLYCTFRLLLTCRAPQTTVLPSLSHKPQVRPDSSLS